MHTTETIIVCCDHSQFFFFVHLIIDLTQIAPLFPYTTLFRSTRAISIFISKSPPSKWPHRCTRNTCPPCCRKPRSEEHTSELQSRGHLVCRLLLEKKKNNLNLLTFNTSEQLNNTIKIKKLIT